MRQLNALRKGPRVGATGAIGNRLTGGGTRRTRIIVTDGSAPPVTLIALDHPATPVVTPMLGGTSVPTLHRGYDWLHVSDLLYKCTRRVAIHRYITHAVPGGNLSESKRITFGIGDKIHDMVKESLARSDPFRAYGIWKCHCGASKHTGIFSDAFVLPYCKLCSTALIHYHEINILDNERSITGGIDFLLFDGTAFYLIEIKSIKRGGTSSFEEVTATQRPLPMHNAQAVIYWHMLYNAGWPMYDRLSVLYVVKDFSFSTPYLETQVKPSQLKSIADAYLTEADAIIATPNSGLPPRHQSCRNGYGGTQSKECPVAATCFGIE